MRYEKATAAGQMSLFKHLLIDRMKRLSLEFNENNFIMPVGIFLVIDEKNGGDVTAQELRKRFNLLDFESQNIIDFYFLGWSKADELDASKGIKFDLPSFEACRKSLKKAGVEKFGGNADLILVDSHFVNGRVKMNFKNAIRIDLAVVRVQNKYSTLGELLQRIIDTVDSIKKKRESDIIFTLSDKLGLAIAKKSLIEFFLKKFGSIIGSTEMSVFAVKNIGSMVDLAEL